MMETFAFDDSKIKLLKQKGGERSKSFNWNKTARQTALGYKNVL